MRAARAAALGLASLLLLAAGSARAQVLGLAGTYTGTYSCKFNEADGAPDSSKQKPSTLKISELSTSADGEQLSVAIDDVAYSGRAFEVGGAGSGHGLASFVRCGSTQDAYGGPHTSVQRATWRVDPAKGTGKVTIEEIFNLVVPGSPGAATVGTCKGSWTRVQADDPNTPVCE